MTKKDYKIIASAIYQATNKETKTLINKEQLTGALISELKKDNPNFDAFRFLTACYKNIDFKA